MEVAAIDAKIEQVTVYAQGARVRRVTTLTGTFPQRLRITGLPLAVIDDTLRVELTGPALATSVRAGVEPAVDPATEEAPELRVARREVALVESEHERITMAIERIGASAIIEQDPSDDAPAAWSAVVAARRAMIVLRAERELALREAFAAVRRRLDDARRALDAAADRDRRGGSARPAREHELRKYIEVELVSPAAGAAPGPVTVHVEYLVAAARWAPSYVARLDGAQVSVEVRAVVAQDAGEDWTGVPLRLSTAEPARFSVLPELAAQRIGRRQQEPARPGFRAPPVGADALYADYERALAPLRTRREPATELPHERLDDRAELDLGALGGGIADEVWDEESSNAKAAFSTPASGRQIPMAPPPAFMQQEQTRAGAASPQVRSELAKRRGFVPQRVASNAPVAATVEPAPPAARLDYGNLVMAAPSSAARGRLVPAPADSHGHEIEARLEAAATRLTDLPLPRGCTAAWLHTYDYAFSTDGAVDVRADGAWHSIAVTARSATAKVRHVSVPREQADVFRVAAIANPFTGPLLPGPIDVYDHGRFLLTSEVEYTPPATTVEIGLGVDAAVKIARNTEFREEATGMLRGALRLHHAITIDIDNVSGHAIDLEVRERIPVVPEGDDDVEVTTSRVEPAWERWTPDPDAPRDHRLRGGHRWRLELAAGHKRTLRAAYEVKIAGKHELVGGNRREP